jgi:hypothetical protein
VDGDAAGRGGALDQRADLLPLFVRGAVVPCAVPAGEDLPQQDLGRVLVTVFAAARDLAQRSFDVALLLLERDELVGLRAERIHIGGDLAEAGFFLGGEGAALGLGTVKNDLALFVNRGALFQQLLSEYSRHTVSPSGNDRIPPASAAGSVSFGL